MSKPLPTQDMLHRVLRYEPETGFLYWRPRDISFFQHTRNPDRHMRSWNSTFAGKRAFTCKTAGYWVGGIFCRSMRAHRVIWCMAYGHWPVGVDHGDHDRANNRLGNLTESTRARNNHNRSMQASNSTGATGVYFIPKTGRWRARIMSEGKQINIGVYATFEDARDARQAADPSYGFHPNHGKGIISAD